jgi:hypothetical protein
MDHNSWSELGNVVWYVLLWNIYLVAGKRDIRKNVQVDKGKDCEQLISLHVDWSGYKIHLCMQFIYLNGWWLE